jgi:hypothetical protein
LGERRDPSPYQAPEVEVGRAGQPHPAEVGEQLKAFDLSQVAGCWALLCTPLWFFIIYLLHDTLGGLPSLDTGHVGAVALAGAAGLVLGHLLVRPRGPAGRLLASAPLLLLGLLLGLILLERPHSVLLYGLCLGIGPALALLPIAWAEGLLALRRLRLEPPVPSDPVVADLLARRRARIPARLPWLLLAYALASLPMAAVWLTLTLFGRSARYDSFVYGDLLLPLMCLLLGGLTPALVVRLIGRGPRALRLLLGPPAMVLGITLALVLSAGGPGALYSSAAVAWRAGLLNGFLFVAPLGLVAALAVELRLGLHRRQLGQETQQSQP